MEQCESLNEKLFPPSAEGPTNCPFPKKSEEPKKTPLPEKRRPFEGPAVRPPDRQILKTSRRYQRSSSMLSAMSAIAWCLLTFVPTQAFSGAQRRASSLMVETSIER